MEFEQPKELNNTEGEKENMPWVQDVVKEEADKMIEEMNVKIETGEIESPKGSEYKIGLSKSGNENEVGIYFFDPTASKEEE
jgi:hypothetical protein